MSDLCKAWLEAKETERQAIETRRTIEDELTKEFAVREDFDGTVNLELGDYKIKLVGRLTHKVDSDKVEELAREAGLEEYIRLFFRWKAELNVSNWKKASPEITSALAAAITTAPGRPSYQIEKKSVEV